MAENDRQSFRMRDLAAFRGSGVSPRNQGDDPLAELARLIGQRAPTSDRDGEESPDSVRRFDERNADLSAAVQHSAAQDAASYSGYSAPNASMQDRGGGRARHFPTEAAREPLRTTRSPLSAPDVSPSHDSSRGHAKADTYREQRESEVFPSRSADNRFRDERRYDDGRYEDDVRSQNDGDDQADSRYAYDGRYEDDGDSSEGGTDYEYSDAGGGYLDDHGYADDADYAGEDHGGEASSEHRRGPFALLATVFVLAILGTAGAFGYRAIFGGSMLTSLPPIIKAEDGPNKIVPTAASAQSKPSGQADADSGDSGEKLVSREEQPVNIQPPANSAPRVVSTVPVFPDSVPGIGPGSAATGYPIAPAASAGSGFGPVPPTGPASAAPGAPVPAPASAAPASIPTAPSPGTANQAAQSAPAAAAPAPATKKIHTVAIRSDQSDSADTTSSTPGATQDSPLHGAAPQQHSAKASAAADANAPLSIVPSGGDTAPPAPPPVPHPTHGAPAHPVPVNTASANETTASAPAAPSSAAAGGGYAVQVSSQHSEAEAQESFRALKAKYPNVLGGREPMIRKADLGAKGVYYRTLIGPFASAEEAAGMCSSLKAAGGSCLVQKN